MADAPSPLEASRHSPLGRAHAEASRLGQSGRGGPLGAVRSVTYGLRRLRYPLMALTTSRELGPCRHALSQRTVGGVVQVHFAVPMIRRREP